MGTKMKVTVGMAILFRHFVLKLRRSPCDARQSIMEAFLGRDIPCFKTFYNHIDQDEVIRAIKKMKALPIIRSVTTDNGCEFLSQQRLDRVFKAETYYTRAYAS